MEHTYRVDVRLVATLIIRVEPRVWENYAINLTDFNEACAMAEHAVTQNDEYDAAKVVIEQGMNTVVFSCKLGDLTD